MAFGFWYFDPMVKFQDSDSDEGSDEEFLPPANAFSGVSLKESFNSSENFSPWGTREYVLFRQRGREERVIVSFSILFHFD